MRIENLELWREEGEDNDKTEKERRGARTETERRARVLGREMVFFSQFSGDCSWRGGLYSRVLPARLAVAVTYKFGEGLPGRRA